MHDQLIPLIRRYVSTRRNSPETELLIGKACSRHGCRVVPCNGKTWDESNVDGTLWYSTPDRSTHVVRVDE